METKTTATIQATTIRNRKELSLVSGKEVLEMLSDPAFQEAWDSLYIECSWATVFQSRDFVATWYQLYHNDYLPVVVITYHQGKLTGLLTMARNNQGMIVGAGDAQAEYQVWLASGSNSEEFIEIAITEIRKVFPASKIMFKYLPPNTQVAWIKNGSPLSRYCVLEEFRQPLLRIDKETLINELKKKDRRYKLNRLKRVGELNFRKIVDTREFAAVFDLLALQYDFRKSAMYNLTNFQDSTLNKQFLFALFEKGILHVTILKLNEEIIGSVINTLGKDKCIHFKGLNTHSLFHSKSSPGILHLLMLGEMLAEEDKELFDLTPGEDSFKAMLATDYGLVHKLTIGSAQKQLLLRFTFRIKTLVKQSATRFGIKRRVLKKMKWKIYQVKNAVTNSSKYGLFTTVQSAAEKLFGTKAIKRYCLTSSDVIITPVELEIKKNDLRHLMMYDQSDGALTRWEFHATAMKRFEDGEHCYTWADEKRLLGCIWLNKPKPETSDKKEILPPGSMTLHTLYVHQARAGEFLRFLKNTAANVMLETGSPEIFVDVVSKAASRSLQNAGFRNIN